MDVLVKGIEPQPNFPNEDLTQANASVLELLLSNSDVLQASHRLSEGINTVYGIMHPVVAHLGDRFFYNTDNSQAFNLGVGVYEAIAAMVQNAPTQPDRFSVFTKASGLRVVPESTILDTIQSSHEAFTGELQRTSEVIATLGDYRHKGLGKYAVHGAAYMYAIEKGIQAA